MKTITLTCPLCGVTVERKYTRQAPKYCSPHHAKLTAMRKYNAKKSAERLKNGKPTGHKPGARPYVITHDPDTDDGFRAGASFSKIDFDITRLKGHFTPGTLGTFRGMRFRISKDRRIHYEKIN